MSFLSPGRISACLLVGPLMLAAASPTRAATVKEVAKKMDSRFELTAVHATEDTARSAIAAAWAEIDFPWSILIPVFSMFSLLPGRMWDE